jgi:hypothetical protein
MTIHEDAERAKATIIERFLPVIKRGDGEAELLFAEKAIAAFLDEVPGGEASWDDQRDLLQRLAINPALVMTIAKRSMAKQFFDDNDWPYQDKKK